MSPAGYRPVRTSPEDGSNPAEYSYEDLYDRAPCGYLSTRADGTVIKVNETFLAMTGYTRSQVVGHDFSAMLSAGSALFYETRCRLVLRLEGALNEVALVVRRPHQDPLHILINSIVRTFDDGRPQLIRTAVFDSTGRRDYERDLLEARRAAERSEARARILQQASSTFGDSHSEASLTATLAETARDAFDATATAVMLLDDGELRLVAGSHPLDPAQLLDRTSPEAEAVRSGDIVTITDLDAASARFPTVVERFAAARLEAASVAPLLEDGSVLGLLICFFGRRREFDEYAMELNASLARYAAQVLVRIRLQSELERMAMHDQLTGLANRELLQRRLGQALSSSRREKRPMALVFLDLDGFKAINDHLGHSTGDSVLEQISARLRAVIRRDDDIARFGGDEFVVVCEDTDADDAVRIAERIRIAVRRPLNGVPSTFPLTVSIGVALHDPDAGVEATADAMVQLADAAMYESKRSGKDRNTVARLHAP